jgi:acetyl esterase
MSVRLLKALRKEPDWSAMSDAELAAYQRTENRRSG